jgi:hypothetical protein
MTPAIITGMVAISRFSKGNACIELKILSTDSTMNTSMWCEVLGEWFIKIIRKRL